MRSDEAAAKFKEIEDGKERSKSGIVEGHLDKIFRKPQPELKSAEKLAQKVSNDETVGQSEKGRVSMATDGEKFDQVNVTNLETVTKQAGRWKKVKAEAKGRVEDGAKSVKTGAAKVKKALRCGGKGRTDDEK
jgi:hypothetical protein